MKTRDLVARLTDNVSPVDRGAVQRLLNRALIQGLAGDAILLTVLYGVRSDMPQLIWTTMFWTRLAFPFSVIAAAMQLADRLGRPGARLKLAWFVVGLPIATMLFAAAAILLVTPTGYRLQLMLGMTWRTTTASIVLLSLPSLAAIMFAMRQLAPTRLVLAGAGAGLLAGAQGVLVYSLYSAEMAIPFWGVWDVLAMASTSVIGAAIAPCWLRW